MTIHGSSRGRGHVWLILLAVLGAALVSLLALPQWDSPARADGQQKGSGQQITLERSADPASQPKLSGATNRGGVEPYIVGGTPVPNGKYNFMAYLELRFNDGSSANCGGTLIDQDSVLTAAHCVEKRQAFATSVGVWVGGTDLTKFHWFDRHAINRPLIHPKYAPGGSFNYDVAVLKLNKPITGNWSKPIALNTRTQAGAALETPGNMLTVAGWGRTNPAVTGPATRMHEVSLPVVSDATAQQAWSTSSTPYVPSLMVATDSQAGKDAAQGDSGGPLFNPGATPTQVGIVSGGASGTTFDSKPTSYTDINNLEILTFIDNAAKQ